MRTTSEELNAPIPANHIPGPRQGQWTYNHYAALADDGQRYEIVDGVLYSMPPSPSGFHQEAVTLLATHLTIHVKFAGLGQVFVAPFDVELAPTIVVQPDICVLLNAHRTKFTPSRIIGGPDLIVEVASSGTAQYDRQKKYHLYARAGVNEDWIVDPTARTIEIFLLESGSYYSAGVFKGEDSLRSAVVPNFPVHASQCFG